MNFLSISTNYYRPRILADTSKSREPILVLFSEYFLFINSLALRAWSGSEPALCRNLLYPGPWFHWIAHDRLPSRILFQTGILRRGSRPSPRILCPDRTTRIKRGFFDPSESIPLAWRNRLGLHSGKLRPVFRTWHRAGAFTKRVLPISRHGVPWALGRRHPHSANDPGTIRPISQPCAQRCEPIFCETTPRLYGQFLASMLYRWERLYLEKARSSGC